MELNRDILSNVYQFLRPNEILNLFETCPGFYDQEIRNKAFVENKDDMLMRIVKAGWKRMTIAECAEKVKKYLGYFIPFLYGRCNLEKWIEKMFTVPITDQVVHDVFFAHESLIHEYTVFMVEKTEYFSGYSFTLSDLVNFHLKMEK